MLAPSHLGWKRQPLGGPIKAGICPGIPSSLPDLLGKLPNRLFGLDIPDQPRVDSTFAAGLLGNILAGMGVSVNAAQGAKKKKKETENGANGNSNGGEQTIIIRQPLEIVTTKPDVIKVDPKKN